MPKWYGTWRCGLSAEHVCPLLEVISAALSKRQCLLSVPRVRLSGKPALEGLERRKKVSYLTCVKPGPPCSGFRLFTGSPEKQERKELVKENKGSTCVQ